MRLSNSILLLCLLAGGCAKNPQLSATQPATSQTALPVVEQRGVVEDGTSTRRTNEPSTKSSARMHLTRLRSQSVATTTSVKPEGAGTSKFSAKPEAKSAAAAESDEAKTAIVGSITPVKEGAYEAAVREQDQRFKQWDRKAAAAVRSICGNSKTC